MRLEPLSRPITERLQKNFFSDPTQAPAPPPPRPPRPPARTGRACAARRRPRARPPQRASIRAAGRACCRRSWPEVARGRSEH